MADFNIDNDGANDDSDQAFRQQYSKALAEAIRESESTPQTSEDLIRSTYTQLCHDFPNGLTGKGCALLANDILVSPAAVSQQRNNIARSSSIYRPSDRLVGGVMHVTDKIVRENKNTKRNTPSTDDDDASDTSKEEVVEVGESLREAPPESGEASYTPLAWALFGKIPLNVLLSDNLPEASAWLGSYRGNPLSNSDAKKSSELGDASEPTDLSEILAGQKLPDIDENDDNDVAKNQSEALDAKTDDYDSLQEVWAVESDPSDFEFESDRHNQILEIDQMLTMDPQILSRVPPDVDWDDAVQGVCNLLQALSYSRISAFSQHQWQTQKVNEALTQLVLILLVPNDDDSENGNNHNNIFARAEAQFWQKLSLVPLHTFRDACLARFSTDIAILPAYLELLHTLLRIDSVTTEKSTPNGSNSNSTDGLHTATIVGLSAFSALCESILQQQQQDRATKVIASETLKPAVLECCDDLALCLEKAVDSDAATAMPWTFMPIFEVLALPPTRVQADSCIILSNSEAQIILNSGLLSQWLLWWQRLRPMIENNEKNLQTLASMERSLFGLCKASPTMIGKYTWRFPNLANALTAWEKGMNDLSIVDSLLWNTVALVLADQPTKSRVQWKKKNGEADTKPAPTYEDCKSNTKLLFTHLCGRVSSILCEWKQASQSPNASEGSKSKQQKNEKLLLLDMCRWIDSVLDPTLLQPFLIEVTMDEVRKQLQQLQQGLSGWPSHSNALPVKKEKLEEDVQLDEDAIRAPTNEKGLIDSLRRSLKTFYTTLELGTPSNSRVLSKTD